ncbi:glycerol-3-phosphate dehydrogenase/oxidase [Histidinibacterium lentulum]|uniref:Glycerol-3-phosphate dehydrogenase/oxidase n=1 Tax=Histidinibacterium lentulum TaxID=2480588 RepID=A0A3N2R7K8_9RHOB|nr:glycerol-3-phosphate dehydrogenase/oxidase [Histidinibacterium lentulum]ROU03459.1 glycerol-3-phosphate dehydrogenase/oxidase [Histidinibacterium lentulum]
MADEVTELDVLIVGAGINGAGLFRDLCAQGLNCAIVDKGDFGSGTSAAPSRLIHGGLKYLETGEFRLVAEATYERNLLLRNAPHLVRPLPTLIPIQSWAKGIWPAIRTFFGRPSSQRSRGAVLIKAGLVLYDRFGARARVMPGHGFLSRRKALAGLPALTPRIKAAGTYYDAAITAPERLVLELVQDGLRDAPGSEALTWAPVTGQEAGVVTVAPQRGPARRFRPKVVVNAAGPWIDGVNACLGLETRLIGGTKGSHILLDHPELLRQLDGRMIYFEGEDGRILLVFPHAGRALVGSTDIPDDDPDAAHCTEAEVAYFLGALRDLLPGLEFRESQIVHAYAGVRPLPASEGVAPGLISRDHSAPVAAASGERPFPVISLVGGKWTTYRAFAAEVADVVLAGLGRARRCATDLMPIGGGRDMPDGAEARAAWARGCATKTGVDEERALQLLARYGTTAAAVAEAEGAEPVWLGAGYSEAEIRWIARAERVGRLEDIVLRRTDLAITGRIDAGLARRICALAGEVLGWGEDRQAEELEALAELLRRRHGMTLRREGDRGILVGAGQEGRDRREG